MLVLDRFGRHPRAATVPTGYNMVFDEEFNESSFNDTQFGYQWTGYPGVYATTDAVSVGGGNLTITNYTTTTGGTQTNWGGCVATEGYGRPDGSVPNYQFTYGYVEARIKFNNNYGCDPAFWLSPTRCLPTPPPPPQPQATRSISSNKTTPTPTETL